MHKQMSLYPGHNYRIHYDNGDTKFTREGVFTLAQINKLGNLELIFLVGGETVVIGQYMINHDWSISE